MPKLKKLLFPAGKYWQAIELKWRGLKYREIAKLLDVSLDTVKSWFRCNGLLKLHYEDYVVDKIILDKRKQQKETEIHEKPAVGKPN